VKPCRFTRILQSFATSGAFLRLNVGLPWQIIGSATIYRPSSTLALVRCLDLLMAEGYTPEAALTRRSRRVPRAGDHRPKL